LKKYQKRLEELNKIENKSAEQEAEAAELRTSIRSVGGKIGARKKIVNKGPDEKTLATAQKTIEAKQPKIDELEKSAKDADKEVTKLTNTLDKLDEAIKDNSDKITES
jgi:peptidoglycan hydrolase CwlO-like protein